MDTPAPSSASPKEPLSPWWVGLAILLLPPLGIFLLLRHPLLKERAGWKKTAYVWCGIWCMAQIGRAFETKQVGASKDRPSQTTQMQKDAREYADLDRRTKEIIAKARQLHAEGDQKGHLKELKKVEPFAEEMFRIRGKYQQDDEEFMRAVQEVPPSASAPTSHKNKEVVRVPAAMQDGGRGGPGAIEQRMYEQGRGGARADELVRNLIAHGNHTPEAERNIRNAMEVARQMDRQMEERMYERGRGGAGADELVRNLIRHGNHTPEAERNIRNAMEAARRAEGRR